MKNIKEINGSICAPKGFFATGIACGLKKSNKKDLALIYSSTPATSAGVFTTNKVKAAPVLLSQQNLKKGISKAIVINAGNANACNGKQGMIDALEMEHITAQALRIEKNEVLVASTGVIGLPLPIKKIANGIWAASRMINKNSDCNAAEAIMTTDLVKKEIAIEVSFGKGEKILIGGIAKGSGMICPNMATMISVITTDAKISAPLLRKAIKLAALDSFNMITVDNDMSTNDTVFALANGQSGVAISNKEFKLFCDGIKYVCVVLAKMIARDGEGATKFFTMNVNGAASENDARNVAKTIAGSNLFKCAVYGSDPNIGRILAAVGYSNAKVDPNKVDVYLNGLQMVKKGEQLAFDAKHASNMMKEKEMEFTVKLNIGKFNAVAWGCDMTEGYIKINAHYHT